MSNNRKFQKLDSTTLTKLRHQLRQEIKTFIESDNLMKVGIKGLKVRLINSKKYPSTFITQEIKYMKNQTDVAIRRKLRQEIQNKLSDPAVVSGGKAGMSKFLRTKNYPIKMIQEELNNTEVFQIHYKGGIKHRRKGHKKIIASKRGYIGLDIAYIPKEWLSGNENAKYLLVCIDTFTRFAYIELIASREENDYIPAFHKILTSMKLIHKYQPTHLVSDNEFDTNAFKKILEDKNIHHILTDPSNPHHTRNAVVERLIQTLKDRIQRYLTANNTTNFKKVLSKIVLAYNTARHRTIGVSPMYAMRHGWVHPPKSQRINKIDDETGVEQEKIQHEFKVGDRVRISTKQELNPFRKGHRAKFSQDVYIIIEKVNNRYRIRNTKTNEIPARLYPYHEMLKIDGNSMISKDGDVNVKHNQVSNIIRRHNDEMRRINQDDPKYRINILKHRINMLKDTKARTSNVNTKRLYQRDIDKLQDEINQLEERVRNQNIQNQQQGRQDVRQQRVNQQAIQRPKRDVQPIQRYENEQAQQELVPHIKAKNNKLRKKQEKDKKELIKFKKDNNIKIKPKKYKDKYGKTASHYDVEIWTEDKKIEKEYDKPYWLQVVLYKDEKRFEGLWSNEENKFWKWDNKKPQDQDEQVVSTDDDEDIDDYLRQVNNRRRRLIRRRRLKQQKQKEDIDEDDEKAEQVDDDGDIIVQTKPQYQNEQQVVNIPLLPSMPKKDKNSFASRRRWKASSYDIFNVDDIVMEKDDYEMTELKIVEVRKTECVVVENDVEEPEQMILPKNDLIKKQEVGKPYNHNDAPFGEKNMLDVGDRVRIIGEEPRQVYSIINVLKHMRFIKYKTTKENNRVYFRNELTTSQVPPDPDLQASVPPQPQHQNEPASHREDDRSSLEILDFTNDPSPSPPKQKSKPQHQNGSKNKKRKKKGKREIGVDSDTDDESSSDEDSFDSSDFDLEGLDALFEQPRDRPDIFKDVRMRGTGAGEQLLSKQLNKR